MGTLTVLPGLVPSLIGGSWMLRLPRSVATFIDVGTECRPSATICRSMWSKVTGLGRFKWIQEPTWLDAPYPGIHAVDGFPSMAAAAPASRSPGSLPAE